MIAFIRENHRQKRRQEDLVAARLTLVIKRAASFHLLKAGWYFGHGEAISSDAISSAIFMVKMAQKEGLWKSNVFPRVDGGLQVDFIQGGHEIEVSIETDGTFSLTHEASGEDISPEEDLSLHETFAYLKSVAKKICTSEHSTLSTSITLKNDLAQRRAQFLATEGYQLSASSAPTSAPVQSIHISEIIIQQSLQSHPFSGASTGQTSRPMSFGNLSEAREMMTTAT